MARPGTRTQRRRPSRSRRSTSACQVAASATMATSRRVRGSHHRRERHAIDVDGDVGELVAPQWRLHLAREWSRPSIRSSTRARSVGSTAPSTCALAIVQVAVSIDCTELAHDQPDADRSSSTRRYRSEPVASRATNHPKRSGVGRSTRSSSSGRVDLPTAAPGAYAGDHRADGEHESRPQPVALEVLAAELETAVAGAHEEAR